MLAARCGDTAYEKPALALRLQLTDECGNESEAWEQSVLKEHGGAWRSIWENPWPARGRRASVARKLLPWPTVPRAAALSVMVFFSDQHFVLLFPALPSVSGRHPPPESPRDSRLATSAVKEPVFAQPPAKSQTLTRPRGHQPSLEKTIY